MSPQGGGKGYVGVRGWAKKYLRSTLAQVIFETLLALRPLHAWTALWVTRSYNLDGYPAG